MSDLPKTALQKFAWYNLIVVLGALTLFGMTYVLIYFLLGAGLAKISFVFLGLLGFLGSSGKYLNQGNSLSLSSKYYKKKARDTGVLMDERDKQIMLESGLIGFKATYLYWVAAGMLTWIIVWAVRGSPVVGVQIIPLLVGGGGLVLVLSMSFSILIRYNRESKADND